NCWIKLSSGWWMVVQRARRSWPRRRLPTPTATRTRAGRCSSWPALPAGPVIWKGHAPILNALCSQRMIPGPWPGATSISAEFWTYRKNARQRSLTIAQRWKRETPRRTRKPQPKKDWLALMRHHERRGKAGKNGMKKSILVILGTALFYGLTLFAQQSSSPAASQTSTQSQPAGKRPPQAKTQQEFNDYNTAYAISGGAAMEKAAR